MLPEGNLVLITKANTAGLETGILLLNVLSKQEPEACPANSVAQPRPEGIFKYDFPEGRG
jgi:hypothetical protein